MPRMQRRSEKGQKGGHAKEGQKRAEEDRAVRHRWGMLAWGGVCRAQSAPWSVSPATLLVLSLDQLWVPGAKPRNGPSSQPEGKNRQ